MKVIAFWLAVVLIGIAVAGSLASGDTGRPVDEYIILADSTAMESGSDPSPDLVVNDENPWTSKVFEVEEVWPGDLGAAKLKLQNIGGNGTLLELQFLNLKDESINTPEPEPTPDLGELSKNLDMRIWWDDNQNTAWDFGETIIAEDTLYNIAGVIYNLGSLSNTETKYLGIAWWVDSAVGNEIMGDRCSFDIQFVLH